MEITENVLKEFKERMKIMHKSEDDNLKRLLSSSYAAIKSTCGEFDFDHVMGKELVFERTRYAYNDSLEFFADNFSCEIMNLTMDLFYSREGEKDGD